MAGLITKEIEETTQLIAHMSRIAADANKCVSLLNKKLDKLMDERIQRVLKGEEAL